MPLKEAVGEVSAEVFSPYPPGIPLLNPGERVSAELIEYLRELQARGGRVQGQADSRLRTIKIVARKQGDAKKDNKDVAQNTEKRDNVQPSVLHGRVLPHFIMKMLENNSRFRKQESWCKNACERIKWSRYGEFCRNKSKPCWKK